MRGSKNNERNTGRENAETDDGEGSGWSADVPLEEVVLAQAFQLEALLNVLERKGVVWKAEVLAQREVGEASLNHHERRGGPQRRS